MLGMLNSVQHDGNDKITTILEGIKSPKCMNPEFPILDLTTHHASFPILTALRARCVCTSVQAPGVPFAGRALEERGGPVDQGAGLPGLGLRPPAVPELGAQGQELPGCGRHLCGGQPAECIQKRTRSSEALWTWQPAFRTKKGSEL